MHFIFLLLLTTSFTWGETRFSTEYIPSFYYHQKHNIQSIDFAGKEWNTRLIHNNSLLNASPWNYNFHFTDDTAKLNALDLNIQSPNTSLNLNLSSFGSKLYFDSWPGIAVYYQNPFINIELGEKQLWNLDLQTHTFLAEEQKIQLSPVDWFLKLKTQYRSWSLENHYQAPLFIRSAWDFQRTQWSLWNRLTYKQDFLSLQLEDFIGEFDLKARSQGKIWLNLDTVQWAALHSSVRMQSGQGHYLQGGFFWGHAEIGDDAFLEPFPISPLSSLELTKWRLQNARLNAQIAYLDLSGKLPLNKHSIEFKLLTLYPIELDFSGLLKSRYITTYPFFNYKQDSLYYTSPWDLLTQPKATMNLVFNPIQLQLWASQWIPLEFNPKSPQASDSKNKSIWGGTSLGLQIQWQITP